MQDRHYWPIRPLATCTVWLALDPWTIENGCLRVIPGSHRGRRLCDQMTEDRNRRNDFRVGHRPELATG
ncbi:MAG TPA: phytanoyl-CoA dioxygenase family protein [Stellaceae bacterium]|nr:phytanoyl-CoA dioxygenase family protein [Stellaceae bacterium]